MLTLNTLRTKFGAVLTIVIGVALVAFIISLRELQPAGVVTESHYIIQRKITVGIGKCIINNKY